MTLFDASINGMIALCYFALCFLPLWDLRSHTTFLLRCTFGFCAGGHLLHSFIIMGYDEVIPITGYWDLNTALVALVTIGYIVRESRKITTLKND